MDSVIQSVLERLTAVAILGSARLDVRDVNVETLAFGPHGATPVAGGMGARLEDVNGDGVMDLVASFPTAETGIAPGESEACLAGRLRDETPIQERRDRDCLRPAAPASSSRSCSRRSRGCTEATPPGIGCGRVGSAMKLFSGGRGWRRAAALGLLALAACPAAANQGLVVRDGTLGSAAAPLDVAAGVDPLGQPADYLITPDLGEQRGANLFHSFASFGIGAGETATFTGPDPLAGPQSVAHVISRVTGGSASRLDGTLRSTIPGADVWLVNPNGVVFGAGAQLDVPGSFHASTSDYVAFDDADLARFFADPTRASVLAIAPPAAFGFLSPTGAGPIALEPGATLGVLPGAGLELAAGEISLTSARILAPGAHVNLEAQSDVRLACSTPCAAGSTIDVGGDAPGTISIRAGRLTVQGGPDVADDAQRSRVLAEDTSAVLGEPGVLGSGAITVDASESVLVDNGLVSVSTRGAGNAGRIAVKSPALTVQRGPGVDPEIPQMTDVGIGAETIGAGAAGEIHIEASDLTVRNGVAVSALAAGFPIGTRTGPGGSVEIAARAVEVSDRSYIATAAWGSIGGGGTIRIDLPDDGSLLVDAQASRPQAQPYAWVIGKNTGGSPGRIEIRGGSIRVIDGGSIVAACNRPCADDSGSIAILDALEVVVERASIVTETFGQGDAGDITIEADAVSVRDGGYVTSAAEAGSSGNGGAITIRTRMLNVAQRGAINSTTWGTGRAGDIHIVADESIRLAGARPVDIRNPNRFELTGVFSVTAISGGSAGSITLEAPEITVADGAIVASTSNRGGGAGGDASLRGERIRLLGGGLVAAASIPFFLNGRWVGDSGDAGRVFLTASESIEISGHHPEAPAQRSAVGSNVVERELGASTTGGANAGLVTLLAPSIRIAGGEVLASAPDGDGGEIAIFARDRVQLVNGRIDASVGGGSGGNVTIDPTFLILEDRSLISAAAGPGGTGGRVEISAQNLFVFPGSEITASAGAAGIDGTVEIHSPESDVSGSLLALPATYHDGSALLRQRCAARRTGKRAGTFTVREAAGVLPSPDGWLTASAPAPGATSGVLAASCR